MVDKSLGTKRTCPNCEARFYDLNKDPIECPKCHHTFTVEPILPSKQDHEAKPEEAPAPEPAEEVAEDVVAEAVELAAEDVDEVESVADVDVDLEEVDVDVTVDPDENAFLEEDDAPVEDIIPTTIEKDDEES
ncbi:TIGR02300 family protein [Thermopetrobacter sp. TC1]|uniref:TIGR02300 family protein n=1 Tax=Thermopetrobacter sp. TC1 TaxID=1495045 RepID=UPI000571A3D0|nr:TIGR02300 family protein [Thermopetrobacter sp. TC1]